MTKEEKEAKQKEKEIQKRLTVLKNSYDMYEKSKKEMIDKRTNMLDKDGNRIYTDGSVTETMELMETMQQDIKDEYLQLGGKEEELTAPAQTKRSTSKKKLEEILRKAEMEDANEEEKENEEIADNEKDETEEEEEVSELFKDSGTDNFEEGNKTLFDTIPLPSKGECYKHKMAKIPVAYLTARDENMIVSPNLYKDGTFIDYLLKAKIKNSAVKPDDLLPGDRDAIILWLRASGYGPEYPITAKDPKTGEQFETTVDLSKIKFKSFKLKGDENGHFEFKLPKSGDMVKFKFLSYKDVKILQKLEEEEKSKIKNKKVVEYADILEEVLEADEDVDRSMKLKVTNAIKDIRAYSDTYGKKDVAIYSHSVTNRLIMNVVEVNGVTDKEYIRNYVMNMNVRDSSALRIYIMENEPGVDYNITVTRPESLGGDSFETFLQLDEFIFLNIA